MLTFSGSVGVSRDAIPSTSVSVWVSNLFRASYGPNTALSQLLALYYSLNDQNPCYLICYPKRFIQCIWRMSSYCRTKWQILRFKSLLMYGVTVTGEWKMYTELNVSDWRSSAISYVDFVQLFAKMEPLMMAGDHPKHLMLEGGNWIKVCYSPTNAQVTVLENNIKINIKIPTTCFGAVTPSLRELIIRVC